MAIHPEKTLASTRARALYCAGWVALLAYAAVAFNLTAWPWAIVLQGAFFIGLFAITLYPLVAAAVLARRAQRREGRGA